MSRLIKLGDKKVAMKNKKVLHRRFWSNDKKIVTLTSSESGASAAVAVDITPTNNWQRDPRDGDSTFLGRG